MTIGPGATIRPLTIADAPACDEVIRSLPYHFGDPDGQRECAEAVRSSPGLVAVRDTQVAGFLTFIHHFDTTSEITWMAVHAKHRGQGIVDGYNRTRAFYRSVGFIPARELPKSLAQPSGSAVGPAIARLPTFRASR